MNYVPFVKLIKSPNFYYLFDVNKNDIIKVDKEIFQYLNNLATGNKIENNSEKVEKDISYLRSCGYLSDNKIKVIRHPMVDFVETFLDRKLNKITLQLTQNCNLRCSYCVYSDFYNDSQRAHSGKRMTFDIAKRAIDFLAEHSIDNKKINIGFYGGEPLLEFELIKRAVEYAESILEKERLTLNITTNATLLTEEIVEYFVKHDIKLLISLDGPKEIHNINRRFAVDGRGSYDTVIKNVEMISNNFPDYYKDLQLSMVMDPQNSYDEINSIFKECKLLSETGIHSTIIDDSYSLEKITYSEEFIEKRNYNIFLAYLAKKNRMDYTFVSPIANEEVVRLENKIRKMRMTSSLPEIGSHSGPCIPGQLRLFVDVNGVFFPCERVSENSAVMKIGNLDSGFDFDKIKQLLNIGEISSEECRNCWAINHCTLCAKYADDGDGFSKEKKLSYCHNVRNQVLYDLKNIILFQELNTFYKGEDFEQNEK